MRSFRPFLFTSLSALATLTAGAASAQVQTMQAPPVTQPGGQTTTTLPAPGAPAAGTTTLQPGTTLQTGTAPNGDTGTPQGGPADTGSQVDSSMTAGARAAGTRPPGVEGRGFMDTRLTWTFGDDDFLHKAGELVPLSPTFSVGERPQYRLFFDNLNSRFSGRENLTHLVMYKKLPAFIPHLTTEAAMVLRFDLAQLAANTGNLNAALYDTGSYLRLFYNTNETRDNEGIGITFFPLDTDRFRLGYLYDLSWGGTAASINQSIFPRIQ